MNAIVGQEITFTNTTDLKGKLAQNYVWDFGDGTTLEGVAHEHTTHTYTAVGDYPVSLIVETECGECTTFSQMITVTDTATDVTCANGGCELLLSLGQETPGIISTEEYNQALIDPSLTDAQKVFIAPGAIDNICPGCYSTDTSGIDPNILIGIAALAAAVVITQS